MELLAAAMAEATPARTDAAAAKDGARRVVPPDVRSSALRPCGMSLTPAMLSRRLGTILLVTGFIEGWYDIGPKARGVDPSARSDARTP